MEKWKDSLGFLVYICICMYKMKTLNGNLCLSLENLSAVCFDKLTETEVQRRGPLSPKYWSEFEARLCFVFKLWFSHNPRCIRWQVCGLIPVPWRCFQSPSSWGTVSTEELQNQRNFYGLEAGGKGFYARGNPWPAFEWAVSERQDTDFKCAFVFSSLKTQVEKAHEWKES